MVLGYCSELYGIERDIKNEPNKRSRRSSRRDRDRRPGRMALLIYSLGGFVEALGEPPYR